MILLISDYHTHEDWVLALIKKYEPEYTLCMGDGESDLAFYQENKIISVKGNCDHANLPLLLTLEIKNDKYLMSHGHLTNVIYGLQNLYFKALENNCNVVLYGHTHFQHYEVYRGIKFINPGAVKEKEYAIITDNNEVLFKRF